MNIKRKFTSFIFIISTIYGIKAQTIGDSLNAFATDLLATTSAEPDSPTNLVLSPYTVWALLSILDEGAKGNTAKQIEKVLGIPDLPNKKQFRNDYTNMSDILEMKDQDVSLDIYNSIFIPTVLELKSEFRDVSKNYYKANLQPIDFRNVKQASQTINKYVSQATRNRIKDFIHPEDLFYTNLFVVSALYFKGNWLMPFNKSATTREIFYDENENKLGEVDMMYHMGFFPYSRIDQIEGHAVELPYGKGDKMSMIVLLPYKDRKLSGMLKLLKKYPFRNILDKMDKVKVDFEDEDVKVYLPRFAIQSDLSFNKVLMDMGILDAFSYHRADFLGMFPHYVYISRLIQRAEIEVNEEGTVASAASGATITNKSPPPKFLANKPFLFFIVNKPTKSIMFGGKVTTPPK